ERLGPMIWVSLLIAVASAVLGHGAAITVPGWFGFPDTISAGAMPAVAGLLFLGVMLLAPRHGVVSKLGHRALLSIRIIREDVLAELYRSEEEGQATAAPRLEGGALGRGLLGKLALARLRRGEQVEGADGGMRL